MVLQAMERWGDPKGYWAATQLATAGGRLDTSFQTSSSTMVACAPAVPSCKRATDTGNEKRFGPALPGFR